jgi:hypothetical protein
LLGDDLILDFVVGGLRNNFFVYQIEFGAIGTAIDNFLRVHIADAGSTLSWSLVAVLRSSLSADSDAAAAVAGCAEAGVTLAACIRKNASNAAKIFTVKFCPLIFITYEFSLSVNAALADGVSHAIDG